MVVLVMAVRQLDAILRSSWVMAIEGDAPEAKGTLALLRARVGPDGRGGGGRIASSTTQHHPAEGRLAFRGGFLGVPDEITSCTYGVRVDGFHQVIVVEIDVLLRGELWSRPEKYIATL
jgi:hypothetical protein